MSFTTQQCTTFPTRLLPSHPLSTCFQGTTGRRSLARPRRRLWLVRSGMRWMRWLPEPAVALQGGEDWCRGHWCVTCSLDYEVSTRGGRSRRTLSGTRNRVDEDHLCPRQRPPSVLYPTLRSPHTRWTLTRSIGHSREKEVGVRGCAREHLYFRTDTITNQFVTYCFVLPCASSVFFLYTTKARERIGRAAYSM